MNPLFDGKSIREGKDRVKEKAWTNFQGTKGVFAKKDFEGLNFTNR